MSRRNQNGPVWDKPGWDKPARDKPGWDKPGWDYLDCDTTLAIAHRGGALEAPQNSMAAFGAAVDMGYEYLELDVRASRDGVLAVYHDPTLDTLTDATGAIGELDWEQIRRARIAGREPVCRLEEVLDAWPGVRLNIDPKHPAAVRPLVELLRRYDCSQRVCVSTFSDRRMRRISQLLEGRYCTAEAQTRIARFKLEAMRSARATARAAPRASGATDAAGAAGAADEPSPAREPGPPSQRTLGCVQVPATIHGWRLVDAAFVDAVHSHGCQVHVWTVNQAAEMRELLDMGADGIMTDRPSLLKQVLQEMNQWKTSQWMPRR